MMDNREYVLDVLSSFIEGEELSLKEKDVDIGYIKKFAEEQNLELCIYRQLKNASSQFFGLNKKALLQAAFIDTNREEVYLNERFCFQELL